MANIGLSKPYFATYTNNNGTISYGTPLVLGKAIDVDISLDGKEPQILYADNGPAESVTTFGGGTVTLGIDEMALESAAAVLGLTKGTGDELTFPADISAPYGGLGFVAKKVHNGVIKWRAVILHKVQFMIPDVALTTQGETVEFQTPELSATILRDDQTPAEWSTWGDYATEAAAVAAITAFFS